MGALGGTLQAYSAPDLAALVLKGLLHGTDPEIPWEVILGQAVQAGAGPHPAGAAASKAGLAAGTVACTVNQGSASGLQAIFQAFLSLRAGASQGILAGGMESASSAPYLLPSARWGTRMGSAPVLDALLLDGGEAPGLPWSESDAACAHASLARALAARQAGHFRSEILTMEVATRRGPLTFDQDQPVRAPGGPAEPSDGAAAVMLVSEAAKGPGGIWGSQGGQPPLARIRAAAQGQDCVQAIARVLATAGIGLGDIDRFELEEASPSRLLQLLSRLPALPPARVNHLGGSLALGHPLAATGARMLGSLAHQLRDNGLRYGITAMEAHGSGLALLLEHP